jgi:hypothetical protein
VVKETKVIKAAKVEAKAVRVVSKATAVAIWVTSKVPVEVAVAKTKVVRVAIRTRVKTGAAHKVAAVKDCSYLKDQRARGVNPGIVS